MTARISSWIGCGTPGKRIKSILMLRSADLTLTCRAIELLSARFPDARVFLLAQSAVLEFFHDQATNAEMIEYPFRDFHLGVDKGMLKSLPNVDLALALYKNQGEGYEEVDAFLLARVRARFYGSISGTMGLEVHRVPRLCKWAIILNSIGKLYGYHPGAAFQSRFLSRRHGGSSKQMILSGPCRIRVDDQGRLDLSPNSVVRIGYVPDDWQGVRCPGGAAIRVHKGGQLIFDGSVNLFSDVKIDVFPGARVSIGEGSYVAFGSRIFSEDFIEIGKNCAISWDVEMADSDFHRVKFEDGAVRRSGIKLGDQVWIGAGSRILKGVTLGNHVIVGAGSVVTGDFPDHAVIAGNPAKLIGERPGGYRI